MRSPPIKCLARFHGSLRIQGGFIFSGQNLPAQLNKIDFLKKKKKKVKAEFDKKIPIILTVFSLRRRGGVKKKKKKRRRETPTIFDFDYCRK